MAPEHLHAAAALPTLDLYAGRALRPAVADARSTRAARHAWPIGAELTARADRPGRRLRRLGSALATLGEILALPYAFALAILIVGVPVALLIRLVMWFVGA